MTRRLDASVPGLSVDVGIIPATGEESTGAIVAGSGRFASTVVGALALSRPYVDARFIARLMVGDVAGAWSE